MSSLPDRIPTMYCKARLLHGSLPLALPLPRLCGPPLRERACASSGAGLEVHGRTSPRSVLDNVDLFPVVPSELTAVPPAHRGDPAAIESRPEGTWSYSGMRAQALNRSFCPQFCGGRYMRACGLRPTHGLVTLGSVVNRLCTVTVPASLTAGRCPVISVCSRFLDDGLELFAGALGLALHARPDEVRLPAPPGLAGWGLVSLLRAPGSGVSDARAAFEFG